MSLQQSPLGGVGGKDAHLMDGDFVQALEALRLRDAVFDHNRVEVLHVREADELVDRRMVALIALQIRIFKLPLLVGLAEERDVENIRFVRVDDAHLGTGDCRGDEMGLNRIGVDAIVYLRKLTLRRPAEGGLLGRFQALEFAHEIEFELDR